MLPDALDEIIKLEKPEESNWWIYGLRVERETDPEKIESIYTEGLEKCPDSHELKNNYAVSFKILKEITHWQRSIT